MMDEQDIALVQNDPEGWLNEMDSDSLATLCRYAAALGFLAIEKTLLKNAVALIDQSRTADARTLIACRERAVELLLQNLPQHGLNMVDLSTDREWWPLMEKARQSMAQTGTPDALDEREKG